MISRLLNLCEEIKDCPEHVEKHWKWLHLMQVYSPTFLEHLNKKISDGTIDPIELALIPTEIRNLAVSSITMDEKAIQESIDRYWIKRAVFVLSRYQNCSIPFSDANQGEINGRGENLLSKKGETVLSTLNQALQTGVITNKIVKMALRAGHKFYMDEDLYKEWDISPKSLLFPLIQQETNKKFADIYPTLQLTKGCLNQCSHCLMRATPTLTHMPYPMFLSLHKHLWKTYRKLPIIQGEKIGFNEDLLFYKFFFDSDSLSYHDDIMGADVGDVFLRLHYNNIPVSIMTRGVNTFTSKKALYKMANETAIALSFVDTPLENMSRNIKQLTETLDLLDGLGVKKELIRISHLQLKSGASVDKKIFRDYPVEDVEIYRAGRAKDFQEQDLLLLDDETFVPQIVIEPSGNIQIVHFEDGEAIYKQLGSILQKRYLRRGDFIKWIEKIKKEHQKS